MSEDFKIFLWKLFITTMIVILIMVIVITRTANNYADEMQQRQEHIEQKNCVR